MMDRYGRVQLLLSQGRFEMAEGELRRMLSEEPHDSVAMALLALCIGSDSERLTEASEIAQKAIGVAPDEPLVHYALAVCYLHRNRYPEAEQAINESLRLDPYDADAFAVLAQARLCKEDYKGALDAAEQGLQIDPEHADCGNMRSIALERLGRGQEAVESASAALRRDPDDPMSHAAYGFTLLNSGRYEEAQVAFREALRLDPHNEMARVGMVNALNNRSAVFRLVHRFYVWMSRLDSKAAIALIVGFWILAQVLNRIAVNAPETKVFIYPLLFAYVAFVILTWIAQPLFNTFLRFHPFGQHLLDRSERWASNLIAPCIALSLFGLGYGIAKGEWFLGIVAAGYWMAMAIPIAATFAMPSRQKRLLLGGATIVVALLLPGGLILSFMQQDFAPFERVIPWFTYSLLGIQFGSNIIGSRPDRR